MARSLKPLMYTLVWLLLLGGIGLAYAANQIDVGTLVFLELCALTLGLVAAIFWRTSHSPESVEELLYKTDHPTRT